MKEQILQSIGKLEIYFEHTFEGAKSSTKECTAQFDDENFLIELQLKEKVNFITSVDYPEVQSLEVVYLSVEDPNGNEIDTYHITDEEIINALNY